MTGHATPLAARSTDHLREVRTALLAAVAQSEWIELIVDGEPRIVVETAGSHALDDLTTLVDVQVASSGVRVGGAPASPADAVEGAARGLSDRPTTAFLVRGEQDASVADVVATLEALRRAGAAHVVIGGTTIEAPLPSWDDCPFPEGKADDTAKVKMRVEFDEAMRAAVVHVVDAPPPGFGAAAVFCVVRHRYPVLTPDARGKSYTVIINFIHRLD